jgi:hypothetical protein
MAQSQLIVGALEPFYGYYKLVSCKFRQTAISNNIKHEKTFNIN